MSVTKLSLIGLGVFLLGGGLYFVLIRPSATKVFEGDNEVSEEPSQEVSPSPAASEMPAATTFIEVLPADCADECSTLQSSPDQYAYCQSVCGLSPDPAALMPKPSDPNLSQNLERKNEAIQGSNLNKCGEITDTNLRKACEVRVTEDLLE